MRAVCLCVMVLCTVSLLSAQETESLGESARKIRAERQQSGQAKAYDDSTYTKGGNINAVRLYERGMNALTSPDHTRESDGVVLIRSSAESGYAPAQVAMGYFAETGVEGVTKAADWYRKAAEQGDSLAEWLLGRLYLGGSGVGRDLTLARRWLQPAAEEGNPFAQYLMGMAVEDQDLAAAAGWLRKAAEQGIPQAQKKYGLLLTETRRGVSMNRYEAYVWLLASANAGMDARSYELAQIEGSLGSSEVEKARSEARSKATRSAVAGGCTGWTGEFDEIPAPPPPELHRYCR